MDAAETPIPLESNKFNDILESKEYELKLDNDIYLLKMELHSNDLIIFNLRQMNNLSFNCYYEKYEYDNLLNLLLLNHEFYDNISKIYKFCDKTITKNKVKLIKIKEKKIVIILKNIVDLEEVECKLNLIEIKMTNEEMIKILFNEIKEIKLKGIPNNNTNINDNNIIKKYEELETKINLLVEENNKSKKELESKINIITEKMNLLIEENKQLKKIIDKYELILDKKTKEINKKNNIIEQKEIESNDNFSKQNNNFKGDPQNLKFKEYLTKNHSEFNMSNFDVYIGLKDQIEYLIFNNINNYNLEIMRIKDKKITNSLKGHNISTTVIRYYLRDNKEEYILSCDDNKLAIIWDIQNNFNKKYSIKSEYKSSICDALLLFNLFKNNYILLSSEGIEYSKLYEFKENNKFVKNIYKTNELYICFMIPWFYQNKYYIIDFRCGKICINNIFDDECYAILKKEPETNHYFGYLYNDNFLCVSDNNYNFIRIWDLVNKVIYKQINYKANYGYGIIPWNNIYTIIGCPGCFVVINIEELKMVKKISLNNNDDTLFTIKKIKSKDLGECLICSDDNNNIRLFSLK